MDLRVERTIQRSAPDVFAYFSDASNNPSWQNGMKSCDWISDGPIGVGAVYRQVAEFMGKEVVSIFEVTGFEPGRSIAIETIESTFPIRVERSVEEIDEASCRVRARIEGGPSGILQLLSPLTDRMAKRSIEADYDRLVTLLEHGEDD